MRTLTYGRFGAHSNPSSYLDRAVERKILAAVAGQRDRALALAQLDLLDEKRALLMAELEAAFPDVNGDSLRYSVMLVMGDLRCGIVRTE